MIGKIGIGGGTGHVIEYAGEAIRELSMDARMTVCNMTIEGGARGDDRAGRNHFRVSRRAAVRAARKGIRGRGRTLEEVAERLRREIRYDRGARCRANRAASYLGNESRHGDQRYQSRAGSELIQRSGSTESRRASAAIHGTASGNADGGYSRGPCVHRLVHQLAARGFARGGASGGGKHVAQSLKPALIVPGSRVVKAKAEQEGLDRIFRDAGFEWRDAGCSMCIAMNEDVLPPGERSASTSNRNFEGRQGKDSRTHLVSPLMAAAAAIAGHFVDVREFDVAHVE